MAVVFWAIVCVDNEFIYMLVAAFNTRSPLLQSITDKVTGFIRDPVKYAELIIVQIQNTKRNHFVFFGHIMIQCFDG